MPQFASGWGGVASGLQGATEMMQAASNLEMQPLKAAHMKAETANLEQQNEMGEIKIKQAKYEQEKQAEKEKMEKSFYPLEENLKKSAGPKAGQRILELADSLGITEKQPDGLKGIQNGKVPYLLDYIKMHSNLGVEVKKLSLEDVKAQEAQLSEQIKEEGNPKKKEEMAVALKKLTDKRQGLNNEITGKTEEIEQGEKIADIFTKGLRIPDGKGGVYPVGSEGDKKGTTALLYGNNASALAWKAYQETKSPEMLKYAMNMTMEYMKEQAKIEDIKTQRESAEKVAGIHAKGTTDAASIRANAPSKSGGEKPPKLTGQVANNPESGKDEYLMTDGSFSGKSAAAKPGVKKEDPSAKLLDAMAKRKEGKGGKDSFGYSVGEVRDVPGKGKFKYMGNNQWQAQ